MKLGIFDIETKPEKAMLSCRIDEATLIELDATAKLNNVSRSRLVEAAIKGLLQSFREREIKSFSGTL